MTKKELIELLKDFPGDTKVLIEDCDSNAWDLVEVNYELISDYDYHGNDPDLSSVNDEEIEKVILLFQGI